MKEIKIGRNLVIHSIVLATLTAGSLANAAPAAPRARAAAPVTPNNSPPEFAGNSEAKEVLASAFSHIDVAGVKAIGEYNKSNPANPLPYWQGLFEFNPSMKPGDIDLALSPWLRRNFEYRGTKIDELDISKRGHALIFAQMMQEYVYEGWFNKENEKQADQQSQAIL